LATLLLTVWLLAVLATFYLVQKPFTPETVRAILRLGLDVSAALLVVGMGAGLGRRILAWLGLSDVPTSDLVWLAPALGLGALAILSLGLGLVGGWRRPHIYGIVLLVALPLTPDLLVFGRRLSGWRPQLAVSAWGRRYLILTLALALLLALAPPTSWDGLFYHLTGPSLYIAQGQISPLDINIPHLSFPSLMEMLFGLTMLIRGDIAAKLLHLAYGLLLAGLIYRLSDRWQGAEAAGWSLLLLAAMPMVAVLAAWAYNDLALAFYQVAALYALLTWQETRGQGWLWAGGILSGLALGLKYTAFPLPVVGLAYLVWQSRAGERGGSWLRSLSRPLVYALVTGIVAAPWYVRNWAFTGNPVYPFLHGGRNWDAFRAAWYAHAGTGIGWDPLQILALPVTMTLGIRDVNYYDGRMGSLFLALAPLVVWMVVGALRRSRSLAAPKRQSLLLLGGFALVCALVWTLGVVGSRALFQSRLFLPGFVALVPLFAESLTRLSAWDRPSFSLSSFVRLLIVVVLGLNVIHQALDVLRYDPIGYLVGYDSPTEYMERVLGDHYRAMDALGEIVPEGEQVLFLWEPRSYYSPRPTQPDAILDNWALLMHQFGEVDEVTSHLQDEGITHVLLYRWGLEFVVAEGESPLPRGDVESLNHFIKEDLSLIETVGSYEIYALRR
jgi:hypothetical protein